MKKLIYSLMVAALFSAATAASAIDSYDRGGMADNGGGGIETGDDSDRVAENSDATDLLPLGESPSRAENSDAIDLVPLGEGQIAGWFSAVMEYFADLSGRR